MRELRAISGALAVLLAGLSFASDAPGAEPASNRLTDLSLEELMDVQVTSVSKRAEKLSAAPAAIYVLTEEDVRRSGATSIPEALRMVPGLNVARIDASTWAVSSRGFNGRFANKLLVLIDGRSVYTPLFSGVFWDIQDVALEDLERIEVIRGPGATLWGANAVNGVINIITKSAKDTQGGLASVGGGAEDRAFGTFRYGIKAGEDAFVRVYGKYNQYDHTLNAAGNNNADAWYKAQGGFRADWQPSEENAFRFQGDLYSGDNISGPGSGLYELFGGNILGSWSHSFADASELMVQAYYDRTERELNALSVFRNTFDLEMQHNFVWGDRQSMVWGGGYRVTSDNLFGSPSLAFAPSESTDHLKSFFFQDEITLQPDRWTLTLGAKAEHNDYSGFEFQPNARLAWTPDHRNTLWLSASRAVRSPSRAEHTLRALMGTGPGPITSVSGVGTFDSENVIACELGWRIQPMPNLSFDLALFYNIYDELRSFTIGAPILPPPALIIPLTANNAMAGETYGGELAATWQVTRSWRLMAGYSLLQMHLRNGLGLGDSTLEAAAFDNPQQQFQLRSYFDLPANFQINGAAYYVDSLPGQGVPGYVRLDLGVGWKPLKNLEVAIGLQNLLDSRHPEYGQNFLVPSTETERNLYGKITWRF